MNPNRKRKRRACRSARRRVRAYKTLKQGLLVVGAALFMSVFRRKRGRGAAA